MLIFSFIHSFRDVTLWCVRRRRCCACYTTKLRRTCWPADIRSPRMSVTRSLAYRFSSPISSSSRTPGPTKHSNLLAIRWNISGQCASSLTAVSTLSILLSLLGPNTHPHSRTVPQILPTVTFVFFFFRTDSTIAPHSRTFP